MRSFIKKYPIWSFLILNYIISWPFLYLSYQSILKNDGITPFAFIGMIGAYGPSIAALVIQAVIDKSKVKVLLRKLIKVKGSLRLYLFVILVPILLYILAYLVIALYYNGDLSMNWVLGFSNLPVFFLLALPFGPMGEELGWRGFMLPKLLENHSVIKSTVLVGLAWGIWHLASFTFPGAAIPDFISVSIWSIGLFLINTIALSMIYTYVHFKSGGSAFFAVLLHGFFNAASNVTFSFFNETEDFILLFGSYVINIILAGLLGYILLKNATERIGWKLL